MPSRVKKDLMPGEGGGGSPIEGIGSIRKGGGGGGGDL